MPNKKRKHRRIYIILAIVAVLLLAGIISINLILENLIKKEFSSQLNSDPGSMYILKFDDVKINIFSGSLKVINLTATPSDSAMSSLHNGKIKSLVNSRIPEFKVKHLAISEFLKDKIISIDEIDVNGFTIDYLINPDATEPEHKKTLALHQIFSDQFKGATVGAININSDSVKFYHINRKDSAFFELDSVRLNLVNITMNAETMQKAIPFSFSDISIKTGHFELNSMKFYSLYSADVKIDIEESSLTIDGFRLIPKYTKSEYNNLIKYNNDWFSISTETIKFNGFNIEDLASKKLLSFTSASIDGPVIEIYRDKRLPDAPFKYKPLLAGQIHKIPVNVIIDSLSITNGKLRYEEQTESSDQPGAVWFDPLSISIYHLTNSPDLIAENSNMEVDFMGTIMSQAELTARLDIDLASTHEEFSIRGTLAPVSGPAFNPMVEQLLPVKIMSADISKTEFHFTADDDISHGELIMEYDNLSVEVIKGKEHDKRAGLISLVANGLIKGKNHPDHGKYNVGNIRFERRKDKATVNYLWNSCKIGIISIIAPVADHTKKDERKELKEEKKEENKEERESKKEHKKK